MFPNIPRLDINKLIFQHNFILKSWFYLNDLFNPKPCYKNLLLTSKCLITVWNTSGLDIKKKMFYYTKNVWGTASCKKYFFLHNLNKFDISKDRQIVWLVVIVVDMWHVTNDRWHIPFDKWNLTCDTWQVTPDMQQLTCDIWHIPNDPWHLIFLIKKKIVK